MVEILAQKDFIIKKKKVIKLKKLTAEELIEMGKEKNRKKRRAKRVIEKLQKEMVRRAKKGERYAEIQRNVGRWTEGNEKQKKSAKRQNKRDKETLKLAYEMLGELYQDEDIEFTFEIAKRDYGSYQRKHPDYKDQKKDPIDHFVLRAEW